MTRQDLIGAMVESALLRVRPKVMTVAVIIGGLLPIMLGSGTSSEVMRRIAAPMVGGGECRYPNAGGDPGRVLAVEAARPPDGQGNRGGCCHRDAVPSWLRLVHPPASYTGREVLAPIQNMIKEVKTKADHEP